MSKKYLTLEEAAEVLGIETNEVLRARQSDKLRGFADRGTWKFKADDVDNYKRTLDSDVNLLMSGSDSSLDVLADEDVLSEQPTVIRKGEASSDSDVRLIYSASPGSDLPLADSDSDVKLAGANKSILEGSDSDIKLAGDKSVTDVQLAGQDSDEIASGSGLLSDSDSDVKLVGRGSSGEVSIKKSTPPTEETIDFTPDEGSVLDDSGISLVGDSGISLERPQDSGISLEKADSGISLSSGSALNLAHDSGISLDITSDSGISLSESTDKPKGKKPAKKGAASDIDLRGTMPMLDIPLAGDELMDSDTNDEVPLLDDDSKDSSFDLADSHTTSVITLDEDSGDDFATSKSSSLEEAVFDEDESVEVALEAGEDDELEEMDVFGAADEDFDNEFQAGESQSDLEIAPRSMVAQSEQEWGGGVFAMLVVASLLMVTCGTVAFDMIQGIWHADIENRSPLGGFVLGLLGPMFGG